MSKRITVSITLSEQADKVLNKVASKQLRSRSHTIEALIMAEYERMQYETTKHKAKPKPHY